MGKFSTGVLAGAMVGIGVMLIDKKTIRKAKRMARKINCSGLFN